MDVVETTVVVSKLLKAKIKSLVDEQGFLF
jgi:hypothetical protein